MASWNEATGFNVILQDQMAPFDPHCDASDLLYATGSSVHMHIVSRNSRSGGKICGRKNNTAPVQGSVCKPEISIKNLQFLLLVVVFCFSWHCA